MIFQVKESNGDYIVEAYVFFSQLTLLGRWHPLRNFGDHQGDAKLFCDVDCPQLEPEQIRLLIKNYNPEVRFSRIGRNRFRKQSTL